MAEVSVTLVRHCEPEFLQNGQPTNDAPLSELGHEQTKTIHRGLDRVFNYVCASELKRSRQTADYSFDGLYSVEPWLNEVTPPPAWEHQPLEVTRSEVDGILELPIRDQWEGWEGSENLRTHKRRVRAGLKHLLAGAGVFKGGRRSFWRIEREPTETEDTSDFANIVLFGHKMTNAVIFSYLLGMGGEVFDWCRFQTDFGSITELELMPVSDGHVWRLVRFNDTDHITEHGLPLASHASHGA